MELTADLFVSVDGYAGAVNAAAYFGYGGPELEQWIADAQAEPHRMLMGRVTYEALAGFAANADDPVSRRNRELPKTVFSSTLTEPLSWQNTQIARGDAAAAVRGLKQESDVPLRTIGSLSLVRSLVTVGLVDRLRIMVFPLLLGGDGREPAFGGYPRDGLRLIGHTVLDGRIALLEYQPGSE